MSMVKSQLPDGFATIRTRGLMRSKSRAEQYERAASGVGGQMVADRHSAMIGVVPPVTLATKMKLSGSGPLLESQQGNSELRYKSTSATAMGVPPVPPRKSSERTMSDRSSIEPPEDLEAEMVENIQTEVTEPSSSSSYRDDDDIYYTSLLTYETFKPVMKTANLEMKTDATNYLNLAQSSEYIGNLDYDFSLPPLKSPQYINELNLMRTRAQETSGKGGGDNVNGGEHIHVVMPMLLSTPSSVRTESPPTYGKIRSSYRSTTPESLDNGSSNSSTYSHPISHGSGGGCSRQAYFNDIPTKAVATVPPQSLQYRKPFSHSNSRTDIIYEEPKSLIRNDGTSICCDTDSNYDGRSSSGIPGGVDLRYWPIHKNASTELLNFTDISTHVLIAKPKGYIRRYATLGHPGKDLRYGGTTSIGSESGGKHEFIEVAKSTSSLNDQDLIKVSDDLLNYKIGCQTTLRSKPVIPWYELAIRKDHRQSCPAMKEAHVVAAFEQSLSNMTHRLQSLTATTEKKDSEILEMRQTIELLRKQSIQAGLTTAHMHSMGVQANGQTATEHTKTLTTSTSANTPITTTGNKHGIYSTSVSTGGCAEIQRHHSSDSVCSLNSVSSGCSTQDKNKKKKGWLRSSFTKAFSRNAKISKTNRHVAIGAGGSLGVGGGQSTSTNDSSESHHHHHRHHHHHHGGNENGTSTIVHPAGVGVLNEVSLKQTSIAAVPPNAGLPPSSPTKISPQKNITVIDNAKPLDAIELNGNPVVEDLKKQLREKDLVLTDIRLEALSSASQLESLKDTVMKMRQEMMNLKHNNERLQRLVTTRSLAGSEVSLGPVSPSGSIGEPRRYSLAADNTLGRAPLELPQNLDETEEDNIPPAPAPEPPPAPLSPAIIAELSPTIERAAMVNEILTTPAEDVADPVDGKKISIAVYLGQPESFLKYAEEINECDTFFQSSPGDDISGETLEDSEKGSKTMPFSVGREMETNEFVIAYTYISGKTTWQNLDYIVRKTFKDYLSRIDPGTNLGLNTDSITSYHLGEAKRGPEMGFPELLPCGYIIGNVKTLYICLQGVGSLAFDSLILRNIVHRYISLLTEHRRLILCGPSGTGKSYLARKLAEFLVARAGRDNPIEAIATFNVDHKSSKELQQYLGHIAEQASMSNGTAEELPAVIILDNLHHASALGDVFSCLLSATAAKLPCIIGTMSQATCNTTNLQLHHNFRWVLTANHMEPVKGFLGRFLRRKLFSVELQNQQQQPQLEKVLKWLPSVWQHINSFLETHSSSDVTIGPRLFLSCPMNLPDSQVWFTDVWNYHLAPYLMEAVRDGVQLYGRRGGAWVDPCSYIRETYPWPIGPTTVPQLRQITADDVGLEACAPGSTENQDPLLNMLMRLQEAANYNGNTEQDSDCASLDSNMTHDSSAGAE